MENYFISHNFYKQIVQFFGVYLNDHAAQESVVFQKCSRIPLKLCLGVKVELSCDYPTSALAFVTHRYDPYSAIIRYFF